MVSLDRAVFLSVEDGVDSRDSCNSPREMDTNMPAQAQIHPSAPHELQGVIPSTTSIMQGPAGIRDPLIIQSRLGAQSRRSLEMLRVGCILFSFDVVCVNSEM